MRTEPEKHAPINRQPSTPPDRRSQGREIRRAIIDRLGELREKGLDDRQLLRVGSEAGQAS
jgi:hypothetical protein